MGDSFMFKPYSILDIGQSILLPSYDSKIQEIKIERNIYEKKTNVAYFPLSSISISTKTGNLEIFH